MSNAIANLYAAHRAELCTYLRRKFGVGVPEAEDVVHQAFVKLASLTGPEALRNPRAYLYRATSHILIDERRRVVSWRRGVAPALLESGTGADEITPERVFIARERLAQMHGLIRRLPPARRASFLMNRLHGLSCAEIARREGYSESAVKKHVTLAMAEIDAALASQARDDARSAIAKAS